MYFGRQLLFFLADFHVGKEFLWSRGEVYAFARGNSQGTRGSRQTGASVKQRTVVKLIEKGEDQIEEFLRSLPACAIGVAQSNRLALHNRNKY